MSEPNEPILRPDSAGSSAGEPKKEDTAGWAGDLFTWLQALTFALVIIMIIFTFFARIIGVDGHSMEPTLQDRDMLLLQCAGYEPRHAALFFGIKIHQPPGGGIRRPRAIDRAEAFRRLGKNALSRLFILFLQPDPQPGIRRPAAEEDAERVEA